MVLAITELKAQHQIGLQEHVKAVGKCKSGVWRWLSMQHGDENGFDVPLHGTRSDAVWRRHGVGGRLADGGEPGDVQ